MTDNEIIKALECLHKRILQSKCAEEITETEIMGLVNAPKLINRQKAEIESLKHRKTELQIRNQELQHEKSEAIKEFAERLKERLTGIGRSTTYGNFEYGTIKSYELDNLVKEMTEVNENDRVSKID